MLNETIYLLAAGLALQTGAALAAGLGFVRASRRRWGWLCLFAASLVLALRCAIPLWVAVHVGLYDFRDAVISALAALLLLSASLGLLRSPA